MRTVGDGLTGPLPGLGVVKSPLARRNPSRSPGTKPELAKLTAALFRLRFDPARTLTTLPSLTPTVVPFAATVPPPATFTFMTENAFKATLAEPRAFAPVTFRIDALFTFTL